MAEKQRAIVYIDGYNLYHGMQSVSLNRYKWLDLQALSESLLQPNMTLVAVKYFTAITKSTMESGQRQAIYLRALQANCNKLKIYYGRFFWKFQQCKVCGKKYKKFEEKKTDVNIACQILNDTHLDKFDCCYIVSGDSDLVPPLQILRNNHPDKEIVVAHPPNRKSKELVKTANDWLAISRLKLKTNQLPEKVVTAQGKELLRPVEWR